MKDSVYDLSNNKEVAEDVKNTLKAKYGEDFEVLRIGNRYGGESFEMVDAYCSPSSDKDIVFTMKADLNGERTFEEDDYYLKVVSSEIDKEITSSLKKRNIKSFCRTEIIKKNKLNSKLNIYEFIDNFPGASFLSVILIDGSISKKVIKEVFTEIKNLNDNINLCSIIYQVTNDYEEMEKELITLPYVPRTYVEEKGKFEICYFQIENNEVKGE